MGAGRLFLSPVSGFYGRTMITEDSPWELVPEGWEPVPEGALEQAKSQALAALAVDGDRPVGSRLAAYYDRDGAFAGASFAELFPNDPYDIAVSDLHAVSLLSVDVGPGATRRFLDDGPVRSALLAALREVPVKELFVAGPDDLRAMAAFYDEVKMHLGEPTAASSDRWVTASKVCARKRPYLFPVRDSVVRDLLGLTRYGEYQIDWQVFRSLSGDPEVVHACDVAVAAAHHAAGDRRLAVDRDRLRVLDAALWTFPPKAGRRR